MHFDKHFQIPSPQNLQVSNSHCDSPILHLILINVFICTSVIKEHIAIMVVCKFESLDIIEQIS
jgi:hypothetical protein